MVNESEKLIKEKYKTQGYKCLRNGQPDFIFFKEDEFGNILTESVFFCEVKGTGDNIRLNQYKCMEILKKLGLNVKLEIVETVNIKTYVKTDLNKIYSRIEELRKEKLSTTYIKTKIMKEFDISRSGFYRHLKILIKDKINKDLN